MLLFFNSLKKLFNTLHRERYHLKLIEDYKKSDLFMLKLIFLHWILASTLSAYTYSTYLFGFINGGILFFVSLLTYKFFAGESFYRNLVAMVLMSFSIIFIQQHYGRIEMHFHVFVGLAFLTLYKDLKPVGFASLFIILHHFLFNELQRANMTFFDMPIIVFNYGCGIDIVLLHGFFVIFEFIVLSMIIYYQLEQFIKVVESEDRIRSINENLENMVQKRTYELMLAKNRAEEADKTKSEFLANMSHEIRTPMNAVLGFTEILMEQVQNPVHRSYVNSIHTSGKSLMHIINDILDLSKIQAGKMQIHYAPLNPYSLFKDLENVFSFKMNEKGLDFIIDIDQSLPQSLILDEVRVRQILFNLIGNAVKFTQNGHIRISAKKEYTQEDKSLLDMYICVEDTGIGIPQNQQEKIFNAFVQKDGQSTKHFGGTGLGLSISNKLASLMNGELKVQSEEDKGSKFTLYLHNVSVSATILEEDEADSYHDLKLYQFASANILIVDDIEANRQLVVNYLSNYGFNLIEAENGAEAVRLSHKNIDLILMDIKMPIMDGYEATIKIKEDPNTAHIPIVALTASVGNEPEINEKNKIFDYFLSKPIDRKTLIYTLSNYLQHTKE